VRIGALGGGPLGLGSRFLLLVLLGVRKLHGSRVDERLAGGGDGWGGIGTISAPSFAEAMAEKYGAPV
jgi:hypothetical protein